MRASQPLATAPALTQERRAAVPLGIALEGFPSPFPVKPCSASSGSEDPVGNLGTSLLPG